MYEQTPSRSGCTAVFLMAEPRNTREKLERDGRPPDHRCELCVGREHTVKEKFRDFLVDLCELFDQLWAFLSG